MKLKEINDKIQEVSNKIKGTKDIALKNKLIQELIDYKKTITFESIEDWQEEYGMNEAINRGTLEFIRTGGGNGKFAIYTQEYFNCYDLYYKTKMRMGQIEKQYNANVDTFDAVIEALKDPKKIK